MHLKSRQTLLSSLQNSGTRNWRLTVLLLLLLLGLLVGAVWWYFDRRMDALMHLPEIKF